METWKNGKRNRSKLIDDIITEILSCSPAKTLFRFKCISKSWHSLICSLQISKTHSSLITTGLFSTRGNYISTSNDISDSSLLCFNLNFLPPHPMFVVYDSQNGILLCAGTDYHFENPSLYVCNPATKKWVKIRYPLRKGESPILEYNPNVSNHFKIYTFIDHNTMMIYSSTTSKWVTQITQCTNSMPYYNGTIFLNGLVHIIDSRSYDIVGKDRGLDSVRIKLPGNYTRNIKHTSRFGLSNGCLHCAFISGKQLYVWILKKYFDNNSWELKYDVSLEVMMEEERICFVPELELCNIPFYCDLDVILLKTRRKLYSYNLIKGEYDILSIADPLIDRCHLPYCPSYLDFGELGEVSYANMLSKSLED